MISTVKGIVADPSGSFAHLEEIKPAEHLLCVRQDARPFIYAWLEKLTELLLLLIGARSFHSRAHLNMRRLVLREGEVLTLPPFPEPAAAWWGWMWSFRVPPAPLP